MAKKKATRKPPLPTIVEDPATPAIEQMLSLYEESIQSPLTPSNVNPPYPPDEPLPDNQLGMLISRQNLYKAFIAMVKAGGSIKDASSAVGILPYILLRWVDRGKEDHAAEKDTYYTRFLFDLLKAKGEARVTSAMRVKAKDPLAWLRNDADGRGWSESPIGQPQIEDAVDVTSEKGEEREAEAVTGSARNVLRSYAYLRQIGCLPSTEDLMKAATSQAGDVVDALPLTERDNGRGQDQDVPQVPDAVQEQRGPNLPGV